MQYAFADFVVDADRAELLQNGAPVRLEPQVFDLLKLLVSANGRMVSRDEIFSEIWGDRIVSDAALSSRIKDARKAIGDNGTLQKYIRTVQRRGLVFVGDVQSVEAVRTVAPAAPLAVQTQHGRATIAVLPFEDRSLNAEIDGLDDLLTDEVTTTLAYWRTFLVVSRQAVARLDPQATVAEMGAVLNADYLLHGTFRRTGSKLKFHITLTSVAENSEVWSDRLVCDTEELLDLEEEIASQISLLSALQLQAAEARRITRKPEADWTIWEKVMRVFGLLRGGKRSDVLAAEELAVAACAESPDWGLPHSMLAFVRFQKAMTGFSAADSSEAFRPALEAAQVALDIDRSDWYAHALTGVGTLWTHRNHALALTHIERAMTLNPSASMNCHFGGCITGFAGDLSRARAIQERLFRIDPTYPYRAVIEADLGLWHLLDGEMATAEDRLNRAISWDPSYGRALQRRAVYYGLNGQRDAAQADLGRLVEMGLPVDGPTILHSYPFAEAAHAEMFANGLRQAGLNL